MGRFPRHYLAKAPQHCAGEFAQTLPFQCLCAARHKPYAGGGRDVGVCNTLRQRQCAGPCLFRILRKLSGRRLCPVTIQRHEMDNPFERHILRETLEQRMPRLAPLHLHGYLDNSSPFFPRFPADLRFTCEQDGLVTGGQFLCQPFRRAATVAHQDPYSRRLRYFHRSPCDDYAPVGQPGRVGFFRSQYLYCLETCVEKRPCPHFRPHQSMMGTVGVGKPPPAVQLSESHIQPRLAAMVLKGDEQPRRGKEISAVTQRLRQGARGVQHIGGNHQIVFVRLKALRRRVHFDIQHSVFDRRVAVAETSLRFRKKARRDVRIGVVKPAGRKLGQHRRRRRPDPRSHLQYAQPSTFRQFAYELCSRCPNHAVGRSPYGRIPVHIGRTRFSAAEQQRQRVRSAEQHL